MEKDKLGGNAPCDDCGKEDNVLWFTENVLWNAVMDADDRVKDKMYDERGKILCIECFVRRAQKKFKPRAWRLLPEWRWEEKE